MRDISKAIEEHKEKVFEHYSKDQILGVFVYGSQNYGIVTENSDVDTKAIVIPTLRDLALDTPVSKELHLENEEHCEVKDIREMVKMFTKQNMNFIEILFTKYYWINPKYKEFWNKYFICYNQEIAYMHPRYTILSTCGQAIHTLRQNPLDGKKFANGIRLYQFLQLYLYGVPYFYAIDVKANSKDFIDHIIGLKTGAIQHNEEANELLVQKFIDLQKLAEYYPKEPNQKIINIMNNGIMALITNGLENFDFYERRKNDKKLSF